MGTHRANTLRRTHQHTTRDKIRMGSYSYSYTSPSSFSRSSSQDRSIRASSQMPEELLTSMQGDLPRFAREFYTPEPISVTGNYYPRYRITGNMETGTSHVSYLCRPYYSYKVPSKYGFSKQKLAKIFR